MAHVLSITDGTTTITFDRTSGYGAGTYTPMAPVASTKAVEPLGVDGGEVSFADFRNVTETITGVLITGSSKTQVQSRVNALETLLDRARLRQKTASGPRVYVQLQIDGEADTWRSEVLIGRVELANDALNVWPNVVAECRVHLTRRFFWEGPEATLASATSITNGSTNVMTLTTPEGAIPSPAKIVIINDEGSSLAWRNFYIGNDVDHGFSGTEHRLSGGTVTWATVGWSGTIVDADISSAVLTKCAGGYFHLVGGFSTMPSSGAYIKLALYSEIGGVYVLLNDGAEVYCDGSELVDFGVWQLPPRGIAGMAALTFRLLVYAETSSGSVVMDFLQLTPAGDYLHLYQRGFSAPDGANITWDGAVGEGWFGSANKYPIVYRMGGSLMVHPGKTNKLSVLFDETAGYTATRDIDVTVTHRPRRLTI